MEGRSLGQLYYKAARKLLLHGQVVDTRGSEVLELIDQKLRLTNPTKLGIYDRARKFKKEYAIAELLWYIGRDRAVGNMGELASIWNDIKDEHGHVESNYGTYIFGEQWEWVVTELESDPESRRAVIAIYANGHKYSNEKDHPCTMSLQFLIRNEHLHLIWNMRSSDLVFGFCNDMFCAGMILQLMLNELDEMDLRLGDITFNLGSLHIYERHFKMIFKASKFWNDPSKVAGETFILNNDLTQQDLRLNFWGINSSHSLENISKKVSQFERECIKGFI